MQDRQQIDPEDLFSAVIDEVRNDHPLDVRTRMLIKESLEVIRQRWSENRLTSELRATGVLGRVAHIVGEEFDKQGFPSLTCRVMEVTKAQTVLQFLRDLGGALDEPVRLSIGGSTALILASALSRKTEDIDVVDELPEAIRTEHALQRKLADRYGLRIAHFQSHYLPDGWENRTHALERFGNLDVRLVDPLDIFIGKLFSKREKDLDDLRVLAPRFDRATIEERLKSSAQRFLADPALRANAEKNWWIVFGEQLRA